MTSRRKFFRLAGTSMLAAGMIEKLGAQTMPFASTAKEKRKPDLFSIGMAGYTLRGMTPDEAFSFMKALNIRYLSVKDFHLPLNSTPEQIKDFLSKASAAGVTVYTVGVIYMKSEDEVENAFSYAARVGVPMIVGAPAYDLLPLVEKKVKETNIRIAIHNHGPEDKLYPSPSDVYDRIKNMDTRMGLCMDIGHTMRNNTDPSEMLEKYARRVYDIHIKDVDQPTIDGKTIEMGRGVIDLVKFVSTLRKVKYNGKCSIEFEKKESVITGVAESIGYFRGIMDAV